MAAVNRTPFCIEAQEMYRDMLAVGHICVAVRVTCFLPVRLGRQRFRAFTGQSRQTLPIWLEDD